MSNAEKFFRQITGETLANLHTAMFCSVIRYDAEKRTADIQPEFERKLKDGSRHAYTQINQAPVLEHIEVLEKGDRVFVVFAERALDGAGDRRHDLSDAVIVGRL